MHKNITKKIFTLTTLLIFILAIVFIIYFANNSTYVYAESIVNEEKYSEYLDSDSLLNSNYTIQDYPHLIATKGAVMLIPSIISHFELQNLNNDDPIVEIVPKELFFEAGDHLYLGQEYGFFINTRSYNTDYLSTVMVFDIITNTNLVETIDRVITTVKPIFQYNFIGLTGRAQNVIINGYDLIYEWMSRVLFLIHL